MEAFEGLIGAIGLSKQPNKGLKLTKAERDVNLKDFSFLFYWFNIPIIRNLNRWWTQIILQLKPYIMSRMIVSP